MPVFFILKQGLVFIISKVLGDGGPLGEPGGDLPGDPRGDPLLDPGGVAPGLRGRIVGCQKVQPLMVQASPNLHGFLFGGHFGAGLAVAAAAATFLASASSLVSLSFKDNHRVRPAEFRVSGLGMKTCQGPFSVV